MNTKYNLKFTGSIDSIAGLLTDLVEKRETGLNLNYKMNIETMDWATDFDGVSRVIGKFAFDRELERKDIRLLQDTYDVIMDLAGV
jgi:hypothetical protein